LKSSIVSSSVFEAGDRDDARFYLPTEFNSKNYPDINWCPLSKLATVAKSTIIPEKNPDEEFNCVNLKDVNEKDGKIKQVHRLLGSKIKGSKVRAHPGDILFARIEPSIYNKKIAIVPENIGEIIGSTEFIVLTPRKGVSSKYLFWILRSDWFSMQITENLMRGSTGRRRLDHRELVRKLVPDVATDTQREIEEILVSASLKRDQILMTIEMLMKEADKKIKDTIKNSKPFEVDDHSKKALQLTLGSAS